MALARELLAAKVRGAAEGRHSPRDSLNCPAVHHAGRARRAPIDGNMRKKSRFQ